MISSSTICVSPRNEAGNSALSICTCRIVLIDPADSSDCAKYWRPSAPPAPAVRVPPIPFPAAASLRSAGTDQTPPAIARKGIPALHKSLRRSWRRARALAAVRCVGRPRQIANNSSESLWRAAFFVRTHFCGDPNEFHFRQLQLLPDPVFAEFPQFFLRSPKPRHFIDRPHQFLRAVHLRLRRLSQKTAPSLAAAAQRKPRARNSRRAAVASGGR